MKELLDSMQKNLLLGSMASKEKENVRSTRESDNSESRMREKVAVLDELAVEFTSLLDKAMRTVHKYSEDDATSLFKYIQDGQLRASEKLVRKYPGLVHHYAKCTLAFDTSFTWGPLHVAAYLGHERLCRVFLELGANMEAQDTWNRAVRSSFAII